MILKSFENASVLIGRTRYWPGEKEIYYKTENPFAELTYISHCRHIIFENLNKDNEDKIFGCPSLRFKNDKNIWWFYPKENSPKCNAAIFATESNKNFLEKNFSISPSIDFDICITPEMTKDLVFWENTENLIHKNYHKMINDLKEGLKKWQHL